MRWLVVMLWPLIDPNSFCYYVTYRFSGESENPRARATPDINLRLHNNMLWLLLDSSGCQSRACRNLRRDSVTIQRYPTFSNGGPLGIQDVGGDREFEGARNHGPA